MAKDRCKVITWRAAHMNCKLFLMIKIQTIDGGQERRPAEEDPALKKYKLGPNYEWPHYQLEQKLKLNITQISDQ